MLTRREYEFDVQPYSSHYCTLSSDYSTCTVLYSFPSNAVLLPSLRPKLSSVLAMLPALPLKRKNVTCDRKCGDGRATPIRWYQLPALIGSRRAGQKPEKERQTQREMESSRSARKKALSCVCTLCVLTICMCEYRMTDGLS